MAPVVRLFKALSLAAMLVMPVAAAHATTFTMQRGINLDLWVTWPGEASWADRDTILPFPEWRRSVGARQLAELRKAGFDFVRMPIDPAVFLSDRTQELRERLYDEVIKSARRINESGLKVIVDLHTIPTGDDRGIGIDELMGDDAVFERYLEIVREMAGRVSREDPAMMALELINEPVVDCPEDEGGRWPGLLQRLFAAARAAATRTTLILPGACWANADSLAKLDPKAIPDDNVVWTFHSYAPFLLTHQGATWAGDFIRYVTGLPYPPDAAADGELDRALEAIRAKIRSEAPWARRSGMLSYLDEEFAKVATKEGLATEMGRPFETVAAWADRNAIPRRNVLLGEFGMIRQEYGNPYVMPGAWRAAYVRDMIGLAEANGFSWSLWSYGGAFGVVDEFDGRKAEPDVVDAVRALPPPP